MEYSPHLLMALLFQVFISTEQMPEEISTFWRRCQKEHGLPTSINRFAVQTLKALLRRLQCLDLLVAMERKRAWDTLLCADTHHYAVGLLAREMRRVSIPMCSGTALCLLRLFSRKEPRWDLPATAFLVEVLECLDLSECGDSVLEIMTRHLQSESREMHRLAIRGLMVLSKNPSMAKKMCSLSESLMELLRNADGEVVRMTLSVFLNVLLNKDILISSPTAPRLAEALQPLFNNDNSLVQLLSIQLFQEVMELVVEKGKKPLKRHVRQSLLPLFFHCHDENQRVAEASRETLLCAVRFLKRRDLKQLLKMEDSWSFCERLLAEDRSRAAEHLRQALPYLYSPQEPLREQDPG
ncbi:maestro heat-like repeat-containing protein family member 7 [Corvus cornix cornix]|uniref:maestro heat-like repeat-containing protein family member 7 n=1 Tax=Corvus cornix cornix TaxID=932674 RepID=UPI0019524C6B|nr:maestro heat-like repeat-containing protein family member 7 [Corvus cornix cornix]